MSDPTRQLAHSEPESRKSPEIQAAVNERARLHAEGDKFWAKGDKLHAQGVGLYAEGDKFHSQGSELHGRGDELYAEGDEPFAKGDKLHAQGAKLHTEGNLILVSAVTAMLGKDTEIVWFPDLTINGVVYTPEVAS